MAQKHQKSQKNAQKTQKTGNFRKKMQISRLRRS